MKVTGKACAKRATTKRRVAGSKAQSRTSQTSRTEKTDALLPASEPLQVAPDAPDRLGDHGRTCWRRIAPLLVELRLLTRLDLETLEALCHQWHDYMTWHMLLRRDPQRAIVEFESGARQKSPEATLRDSAYDRWLKLLPRFGLSPEARRKLKRLKEPAAVEGDPVAAFARQKYEE